MHELVHALQDQYVNLDSLEHIIGDDDRAAAVQAVIEGEATYEQVFIMAGWLGQSCRATSRRLGIDAHDDPRGTAKPADLLDRADGDSGDARVSVHQRRRLRPPFQVATTWKAAARQSSDFDRATHARLGVFRDAADARAR
jgi:hypothetical protein